MSSAAALNPTRLRPPAVFKWRLPEPGQCFGRYFVLRHLASGGMAEIYEARHTTLGKPVALKVLKPSWARIENAQARFLREGERAAQIRHPNVVDISDIGSQAGAPYLVLEYLEGEPLSSLMERRGKVKVEHALRILLPVIAALCAGHRHHIVHRDVTPDNIFLAKDDSGRIVPKLLDFGISRLMDRKEVRLTLPNTVIGSPTYFAPEQARGDEVDGRTDQYMVAAILYEMVTGHPPRSGHALHEVLTLAVSGEITPVSTLAPDLDPAFVAVVTRALSPAMDQRYGDLSDFGLALLPFAPASSREHWEGELQRDDAEETLLRATMVNLVRPTARVAPDRTQVVDMTSQETELSGGPVTRDDVPSEREVSECKPASSSIRPRRTVAAPAPAKKSASRATPRSARAYCRVTMPRHTTPQNVGGNRKKWFIAIGVALLALCGLGLYLHRHHQTPPAESGLLHDAEHFQIAVQVSPADAEILLDGAVVAAGSYAARFPVDGKTRTLTFRREGFASRSATFRDAPPPSVVSLKQPVAADR